METKDGDAPRSASRAIGEVRYEQQLTRSISPLGNIFVTLSSVTPASSVFIILPAIMSWCAQPLDDAAPPDLPLAMVRHHPAGHRGRDPLRGGAAEYVDQSDGREPHFRQPLRQKQVARREK